MKSKEKVLIVEDESINRNILNRILGDQYDLIEANNGLEGWKIIQELGDELSAVLTDIVMPISDGYELLDKIREHNMTELPVVVMTAYTNVEAEKKALDKGAWDYITKPYQVKILMRRLENAISRRQVTMLRKIEKMAAHDPLTGLHNRNRFFQKAEYMINANKDITFQFLRIDVDHFSLYNSSFGDVEGDKLIQFIAELGKGFAKKYEYVEIGRINADVFGMCIPQSAKLEELQQDVLFVQDQLSKYKENYLLEVSVGIYIIEPPFVSMAECYRRATLGAQQCKSKYGKHIGYYDEEVGKRERIELSITNEMKKALMERQFIVYIQPKMDITKDICCGGEALVRWDHPERGLVSPGLFIPVFERNGFILELDYYVWEETCKILSDWKKDGIDTYPVSINISRVSMNNPKLIQLLNDLTKKYEIEHKLLQLEITESAYMSNPGRMKEIVDCLRSEGYTLLMDDFGSDYSSLNTLKNIAVDILKIDMKFLEMGDEDEAKKGEIIIESIIQMSKRLGMQVVVEGVETEYQRDFLRETGCRYVQGYYYSKPIQREDFEKNFL